MVGKPRTKRLKKPPCVAARRAAAAAAKTVAEAPVSPPPLLLPPPAEPRSRARTIRAFLEEPSKIDPFELSATLTKIGPSLANARLMMSLIVCIRALGPQEEEISNAVRTTFAKYPTTDEDMRTAYYELELPDLSESE